ncbi:hypothetical protein CW362_17895 [Streptomyces populi]|uniref:Uncharacterized protein n=1 Tax=Streptomyces populi TaxID=2058924 RepID=A0A2I0SNZ2_9ACTN|nr:hypothetical protein [Streptomyces populi]PKT71658.1 hypothetical protein CW362_17895 [Streptomyces populi]
MFEYELQQIRSAELIREAQNHRLAKEAASGRRAARRAAALRSAHDGTDERAHRNRLRRHWFARAV